MIAFLACAAGSGPAWAAIEIDEQVGYRPGLQSDEMACPWETGMVAATVASSEGGVVLAGKTPAAAVAHLSLRVEQMKRSAGSRSTEYALIVRGDVVRDGKLLATRDFAADASFKNGQPACDALRAAGTSIGESAAEWVTQARFIDCGDGCSGIHPDETIVVGAEVLLGAPDAVNSTVRNDCQWLTGMVSRLVKSFNEYDPPPRARLESRAIEIEQYRGRRLVLRVNDVHAVGGGGLTGPKWMNLSGELREGDTLVASFQSSSTSGRGLTTCRSVDSLSDSSAAMIVEWLRNPTLQATLR